MIYPTLHLNGTSGTELAKQLEDARSALMAAVKELGKATPNARDYYPQGPNVYGQARKEHEERIGKIESVRADLLCIYEHVLELIENRERMRRTG